MSDWEPVGKSSDDGWEPVGKPHAIPGVSDAEVLKKYGYGIGAVGEFLGSVPGAITGAVAGLGHLGATTGIIPLLMGQTPDVKGALNTAHQVMGALTPSQMIQNAGELAGSKAVTQAVDDFRESDQYREIVERPMGALVMGTRDLGSNAILAADPLADFDTLNRSADVAELALIGGAAAGIPRSGRPSVRGLDLARELAAKERAAKAGGTWEPVGKGQMDLPLGEPRPLQQPGPDVYSMMDRVNERMTEVEQLQRQEALNRGQPDLFAPQPRESFPGVERTEQLRQEQRALPLPENTLIDPTLAEQRLELWRENTRTEDMRAERSSLDFPLRIEAFRDDPYVATLRQEYEAGLKQWRFYRARNQQYPGNVAKMEEGLRKAQEAVDLAKKYATEGFGITPPDHYSGSLWGKRVPENPMTIEKSGTRNTALNQASKMDSIPWTDRGDIAAFRGKRAEKTLTYNLGKRPRQKGSVEMDFLKFMLGFGVEQGRVRALPDRKRLEELHKNIQDRAKSIEALEKQAERTTSAEVLDKRLERLYLEQMKAYREIEARLNPSNPHFNFYRQLDANKGKYGRQKGIVGLDLNMRRVEDLPEDLKNWVSDLAIDIAQARVAENNGYKSVAEAKKAMGERAFYDEARPIYYQNLENPHFIKQAISISGGWEGTMNIPASMGTPGKIGRQEGAIKLNKDPEFLKFKDQLPPNLRGQAKQLYKEYRKALDEPRPEVTENEAGNKALDKIPGVKTWRDEIAPITKPIEELIPDILKEKDLDGDRLARWGRQLISGGKLLGFGTQNTVVRWITQTMDRAIRESYKQIHELVLDGDKGFKAKWEQLSKKEVAEVWSALISAEGKFDFTREELFNRGLNEKQVNAAEAYRNALDKVYDILNEARASRGKKPFEKRLGYIPSRFRGDWVLDIRDGSGSLVHRVGATTEMEAIRIRKWFEEKHPELTIGQVKHEPMHRFKDTSEANAGYQELLKVLTEDDPRVEALESTYQDYLAKQAYDVLSVKKHFWDKKGVGGAEGFKEWQDASTNALEGLRSTMNYMDHALKWAEVQKSFKDIKRLLSDEQVKKAQPNAVAWAQAYIDQSLGRSTRAARAIDSFADIIARETGIGQSLQLKGIREVKKYMTAAILGVGNLGFSLSQFVQVLQTVPSWMLMLDTKGASNKPLLHIAHSYAAGGHEALMGFAFGPERMTPLGREAWKYAKDYGIVEPKILEDIRHITDYGVDTLWKDILFGSMTYPEKVARTQAYLTWVHYLYSTKQFKMGKELYETAASLTDMTMVDYRSHERPNIYKEMGILGEAANALTTYKHNQYSQLWALGKRSNNIAPFTAYASMLLMLSGLMGLPGREDIDGLINLLNTISPTRIPTTREIFLKAPNVVGFGGLSSLTGLDLSTKFSMANALPDNPGAAIFPFGGTLADIALETAKIAGDPSMTQLMRMLTKATPNSMKALPESYFTEGNMVLDPKTMEGKFQRGTGDWVARLLGLRSLKESRAMQSDRVERDADRWYEQKRSGLIDKAQDALFRQDMNTVKNLAQKFINNEGDLADFITRLEANKLNQKLTGEQRRLLNSLNNPARAKRLQGMR